MGQYEHFFEQMAAEAPEERRPYILLMGRLEIRLGEELKAISPYLECVVNPQGWNSKAWDGFQVKVGDNHGHHICSFLFEFPYPTSPQTEVSTRKRWRECAERAETVVVAAIRADHEWCKS